MTPETKDAHCLTVIDQDCIHVIKHPSWKFQGDGNHALVVMVNSHPGNFQARSRIRSEIDSFLKQESFDPKTWRLSIVFLIGMVKNETIEAAVHNEATEHRDLIQIGYPEGYRNLAYKILSGIYFISLTFGSKIGKPHS